MIIELDSINKIVKLNYALEQFESGIVILELELGSINSESNSSILRIELE